MTHSKFTDKTVTLTPSDIASLELRGGPSTLTETIQIRAHDGKWMGILVKCLAEDRVAE